MTAVAPAYHLFGFLSMTPMLWQLFFIQLVIVAAALALCFVPKRTARAAKLLRRGNTLAVVLSMLTSALTVAAGYVASFAVGDGPDSERAAQLATHLLTVMNGTILGIGFAIVVGALLMVQSARRAPS